MNYFTSDGFILRFFITIPMLSTSVNFTMFRTFNYISWPNKIKISLPWGVIGCCLLYKSLVSIPITLLKYINFLIQYLDILYIILNFITEIFTHKNQSNLIAHCLHIRFSHVLDQCCVISPPRVKITTADECALLPDFSGVGKPLIATLMSVGVALTKIH